DAELHRRNETLATGEHLGLAAVSLEDGQRLVEARRRVILERCRVHLNASSLESGSASTSTSLAETIYAWVSCRAATRLGVRERRVELEGVAGAVVAECGPCAGCGSEPSLPPPGEREIGGAPAHAADTTRLLPAAARAAGHGANRGDRRRPAGPWALDRATRG